MIDGHVLVLNRSWMAVNIATVRRALTLLYQGAARAVHPQDYSLYDFDNWCELSAARKDVFGRDGRYIVTPSMSIRVPEVILLSGFNGFVRHEVRFSRRNIFERDKNTCQYCGKRFAKADLTLDHVVPRSCGGIDSWDNLVLACVRCNVRKANRTPDQANMPLIRRPAKPAWLPKFGARVPLSELSSWQRFLDAAYWDVELRE